AVSRENEAPDRARRDHLLPRWKILSRTAASISRVPGARREGRMVRAQKTGVERPARKRNLFGGLFSVFSSGKWRPAHSDLLPAKRQTRLWCNNAALLV